MSEFKLPLPSEKAIRDAATQFGARVDGRLFDQWLLTHDAKVEKAVLARLTAMLESDVPRWIANGSSEPTPDDPPTVVVRTGWGGEGTALTGSDHGADNLADDYAEHDGPRCTCSMPDSAPCPVHEPDDSECNCIGELWSGSPAPCPVHGRCSCPDDDYDLACPLHGPGGWS